MNSFSLTYRWLQIELFIHIIYSLFVYSLGLSTDDMYNFLEGHRLLKPIEKK